VYLYDLDFESVKKMLDFGKCKAKDKCKRNVWN